MNDSQYLEWIASNLETFHPGFNTAYMSYYDNKGSHKQVKVDIEGEQPSDLDFLKACIDKANYE